MKTFYREKKLTNILDNTTKKLFKQKGFHIFKLILEWHTILPDYTDICEPISIKNQNGRKLLEIAVSNEALLFELQYNKDFMISSINNYFGGHQIDDIKFKIANYTIDSPVKKEKKVNNLQKIPSKLKKEIDIISDHDIQTRLENIAQRLKE